MYNVIKPRLLHLHSPPLTLTLTAFEHDVCLIMAMAINQN